MSLPLYQLPVVQNWDCHVCGTCCQEYQVTITDEERRRIEAQGWNSAADLGGYVPFRRIGPFWSRRTVLNHRPDGCCVFLSEKGRCRIHERHGYETKPLPCRLFPFVLVPAGDRWAVGLRFACPSAAESKGRPLVEHNEELREFAAKLAEREGLQKQPDGSLVPPPFVQGMQQISWPDVHRLVDGLLDMLHNRSEPMERRLRKCLAVATELRKAKLEHVQGARLSELMRLVRSTAEGTMPANLMTVPPCPPELPRCCFASPRPCTRARTTARIAAWPARVESRCSSLRYDSKAGAMSQYCNTGCRNQFLWRSRNRAGPAIRN